MTSFILLPEWFDAAIFIGDLVMIASPLVGLALLVAGGLLIIRSLKRVS